MKHNFLRILGLIFLSVLVCGFVFAQISKSQIVPWDEGGYFWQAYEIREGFINGGLAGFWDASKTQVYYPFFQSWYLILMSSILGFGIESIRLANILLLVPATVLIWLLSRELIQKRISFSFIPVFLLLSSPMILFLFSNILKESFGITLTLLSFWLYFKARQTQNYIFFFLTGITLSAIIFTKYNYGVLAIVPIVAEAVIWCLTKKQKGFWAFQAWLFIPLIILSYMWLFLPYRNLPTFMHVLFNNYQVQVNIADASTLGHILYYPQEIFFSYIVNPTVAIFVILGFFYSLKNWRDGRVRVLFFLFLLNLFLGTRNIGNNQGRYIATSVPALFILAGLGLHLLYDRYSSNLRKNLHLKTTILSILGISLFFLVQSLTNFPNQIRATGSHQIGTPIFYEKIHNVDDRFDFNITHWPRQIPGKEELAGQTIDDVFEFIFSSTDLSAGFNLLTPINELNPGLFNTKIALKKKELGIATTLTPTEIYDVILQVTPNSRFDNLDYRRSTKKASDALSWEIANIPPVAKKYFPYLGIEVIILNDKEIQQSDKK